MFWRRLLNRAGTSAADRFAEARREMVERQLAQRGITDPRVLEAMGRIPRENFVAPEHIGSAYADSALSIACAQTISQPYMVGLMSQELRLTGGEKVLEIGTGSGYQTAVLSRLAGTVFTIERHADLAEEARRRLKQLGCRNVVSFIGDGTRGRPDEAPFDRILVTAGGPELPRPLIEQLASGGRLLAPVGDTKRQTLTALDRLPTGELRSTPICSCIFVGLIGEFGWKE